MVIVEVVMMLLCKVTHDSNFIKHVTHSVGRLCLHDVWRVAVPA
jgi:hypothetical protein